MAPHEETVRVDASSEDMERGAEFSCGEWGIPCDAQGPRSLCQEREILAVGRSWGVKFVKMGYGKALDMLSKDINTKYGTSSRDILSLHLKDVLAIQC